MAVSAMGECYQSSITGQVDAVRRRAWRGVYEDDGAVMGAATSSLSLRSKPRGRAELNCEQTWQSLGVATRK
jgi:hypothetical protein